MAVGLASLGLPGELLEAARKVLEGGEGLLLVTVPAGDDASDACAALLSEAASAGLDARRVDASSGSGPLQAALDGGADVVVLPALEGAGAAVVAVRAAATGRLVVAGLAGDDAAAGLVRLLGLHADPVLLSAAFRLGLHRRRLRALCRSCAKLAPADPALLEDLRLEKRLGGRSVGRPSGCPDCRGTGYRGTLGAWEGVAAGDRLAAAVAAGAAEGVLRPLARPARGAAGEAVDRAAAGETSLEEVRDRIPYLELIRASEP